MPPDLLQAPTAEERFASFCARVWGWLPSRLRGLVPVTFVGFATINGFTFSVDLALLGLLDGPVGLHHTASLTIAYGVALTLAFVLNRWLNFRSHGPIAGQVGSYVVVVALNFAVLVLGLASLLAWAGLPLVVARVVAGGAEALWMYAAMRWWVFRR